VRPGVEICDGLDNDCNGVVDDVPAGVECECQPGEVQVCYTGAEQTREVGACRDGQQGCAPGNRFGACVGERVPEAEICDGADNDCDGQIDEAIPGAGMVCGAGNGACAAQGVQVCDPASGRLRCDAQPGAAEPEICDGIDNDCNGLIDDGFDLGEPCVSGQGVCLAAGLRRCGPDGGVVCDAEPAAPMPELCDGADNDCDGRLDEGFDLGAPCSAGVGRCRREGVMRCRPDGGVLCTAQAGAGQIEVCNGTDDDCDGAVDEGDPGGGGACAVEGVGQCAFGVLRCQDAEIVCRVEGAPVPERCDGGDNDCDGIVDEGDDGGLLIEDCYEGPEGTAGVGLCQGGQRTCLQGAFGECAGQIVPGEEACNQVDDDCNGAIDDVADGDCVCEPGAQRACVLVPIGVGVGICRAGQQECLADGTGFGPCLGAVSPRVETCNGLDDDCDGEVDDVLARGLPCQRGFGICQAFSVWRCDADSGDLVCDAEPGEPGVEVCNGLDDDCNGVVDDLPGVGDLCAVGEGACRREANRVCDVDAEEVICPAMPGPAAPEACNGVDDDCDGSIDEALPRLGDACQNGDGACARDGVIICDGRSIRCDAVPGEPDAETCDGVDEDCDTRVDEETEGTPCVVGEGACATEGNERCTPDGLVCDAEPGDPGVEVCNDADDDCDGRVDEGLFCRAFRSCQHALDEGFGVDGVYRLDPDGDGQADDVYCDQTTDGGGWTLVASTRDQTLNDQAGPWHADLRTLAPAAGHLGVWDGMRPVMGDVADIRFACRDRVEPADAPLTVDLSVYAADWYERITRGVDGASCFEGGAIPARRDNRSGAVRTVGQGWASETDGRTGFVGEDACGDTADFTVDFDDRGMDAHQSDGTDWGEDDGTAKCGRSGVDAGQWFVFARERRPEVVLGRVALLGPSGLAGPLRAGGFEVTVFNLADLPAQLDLTGFDAVFLGRILGRWERVTPTLRDALSQYSINGGNVVTEYDGLTLLATTHRDDMRWRAGAPQPWGWFPISVGGGSARAVGTPISAVTPRDPTLRNLANPFSAGSGTEAFFTVYPVDQGVDIWLEEIATFPGLPANPQFPNASYPAVLRGVRCGGNVIVAPFDYQDGGPFPAGLRFIQNLAATAISPAPTDQIDVCPPPRPQVMRCGAADVDVATFFPADQDFAVVEGCRPGAQVQALLITRNADVIDGPWLRDYLTGGGRIVTELGMSARTYNAIFDAGVQAGGRQGRCRDNPMPAWQLAPTDRVWRQVDFAPTADTGCGDDMAGWPGITAVGGWTPRTVSLAYRRHGAGVLWLVEADWQDGQNTLTAASRALMSHLITGRATRGLSLPGPYPELLLRYAQAGGFEVCASAGYGAPLDLAQVRADCDRDVLMLACRRAGRDVLSLGGMVSRGTALDGGDANGLSVYRAPDAWGFAPSPGAVNLDPCDITPGGDRLCWHVGNDALTPGFRCGDSLIDDGSFERVILHRRGAVTP
jgi:hypothetical protein